jgi:excisionase family DNA binding protein
MEEKKRESLEKEEAGTQWLTANEAACYLKIKPRTLLAWVRAGKVRAYALSGTERRIWRFKRDDLDSSLLVHPVVLSESPTVLTERRQQ